MLHSPTLAIAIAPTATLSSDNKLFEQFMKAYLNAQVLGQIAPEVDLEPCK